MKVSLDHILAQRRAQLEATKKQVPLARVQQQAALRSTLPERHDFAAAIEAARGTGSLGVIAELKQASPSRGLLCRDYNPRRIALGYQAAGAAAVSVLTEERFFKGSLRHLSEVRQAVRLPVLRKDFILDAYQVYESVAAGADALLLIVATLGQSELCELIGLADQLRIAALVEAHSEEEISRALSAGARIIGINNRDLHTFEVSLETSSRLRTKIPAECLAVSESGIATPVDLERLRAAGFDAALIGERLMTDPDPEKALKQLLASARQQKKATEEKHEAIADSRKNLRADAR